MKVIVMHDFLHREAMMKYRRNTSVVRGVAGIFFALLCASALAEEATGKVVWVDMKNSALLLECAKDGCTKIPTAQAGETFSFAIPEKLKSSVVALKEGQQITVQYEQAKEGNYALVALKQ
jgi:hypothetical protein